MERTIEFTIPKGYVIDKENSTEEKLVYKLKDTRPKSWEEFCRNYPVVQGECYIGHDSFIKDHDSDIPTLRKSLTDKNYCISPKDAAAFLALMQLRQLRKAWIEGMDESDFDCAIYYDLRRGRMEVAVSNWLKGSLLFPNLDMAHDFIECFKDLLSQASILL